MEKELLAIEKQFAEIWRETGKYQPKTQNTDTAKAGSGNVQHSISEDTARVNRTPEEVEKGNATADFIDSVSKMLDQSKVSKRKFKIGTISEAHKAALEELMHEINPDFSASGYELWIDGTGAEHIEIRHGENGEADNTMATREDKALIPWVANTPDGAEFIRDESGELILSNRFLNADGSRAPQIRIHKEIGGNSVYVAECVPDSQNKRIYIVSAYKKSSTNQLLNIDSEESPQLTPEASFDSGATNDSIAPIPENVKTDFSLSSDTEGTQLSNEQSEYFADSKIRDENGRLKVMYHGTPNGDFTVFKDGTYFTEHKWYADLYQNPGASSLNSRKTVTNPKTYKVYLDIKKPFDIADAEARSIYINDYIKGGNAVGINPYLSDAEYAKIDSIDWTEGEDLREFLIDNGYDYDGLVLDEGAVGGYGDDVTYRGKSYVVFSPEQVKDVDNKNPTADPDINFSLSAEQQSDIAPMRRDEVNSLDKYTEKQYNDFGWARDAEAITKNELDDLYSKLHEKRSLKQFMQTSRGEAVVEVNDDPHANLGVDNVFAFVTGTKNNPQITRVVRINAFTEDEMELFREEIYFYARNGYRTLEAYARALGEEFIRYYDRSSSASYREYTDFTRAQRGGAESDRTEGNSGFLQNGAGTFAETGSTEIAPVKETSSDDGVFFDDQKVDYSLSTEGEEYAPIGDFAVYGKDIK